MFKEGDEVVCVDDRGGQNYGLIEGRIFKVRSASLTDCILYEVPDMLWLNNRFVLASEYSAADNLKEQTALDIQHGGQHYKGMKIQPVEFIHANNIGYMEGNAIKYLCRWQMKNGLEDLNKAKHYIELLIEMETASESKD